MKPKKKGYARVSSRGQGRDGNSLEDQEKKLLDAGCDEVVMETYTGTKMDRPKFTKLLEELQPGDTLVVTKLDRFARTASAGVEVIKGLLERGVSVHVLNMGLVEDTPTGRLILNILLAFAEFERDNIVERLADGKEIEKAKNPNYKEVCRRFLADEEDFAEEELQRLGITKRYYNRDLDECCKEIEAEIASLLERGASNG